MLSLRSRGCEVRLTFLKTIEVREDLARFSGNKLQRASANFLHHHLRFLRPPPTILGRRIRRLEITPLMGDLRIPREPSISRLMGQLICHVARFAYRVNFGALLQREVRGTHLGARTWPLSNRSTQKHRTSEHVF